MWPSPCSGRQSGSNVWFMHTGREQVIAGMPAVEELDFAEVAWGGVVGEGGFGKVCALWNAGLHTAATT